MQQQSFVLFAQLRKINVISPVSGEGFKYTPLICSVVSTLPKRRHQKEVAYAENGTRSIRPERKAVANLTPDWQQLHKRSFWRSHPLNSTTKVQRNNAKWACQSNIAWTLQRSECETRLPAHKIQRPHPSLDTDGLRKSVIAVDHFL